MKIAHYFFRVNEASGGVSRAIYDLVGLSAEVGHEVVLMTAADSQFPRSWENAGGRQAEVVRLCPPSPALQLLDADGLQTVADVLRDADVLHLHGLWRPSSSQVARLAREMDKPYVLTIHGTLDDWAMRRSALRKRIYYRLFEHRNLAGASLVHCTAEEELRQSRRWIPHDRVTTVPYAVDLSPYRQLPAPSLFRESHPELDDRPSVLFLSRLHPKKGAEILIEAIHLLKQQGLACQLWLAGSGEPAYVRRLRKLCRQLVPDARFLGLVTGEEKLALYQCADVFALPTHQENFALVLPEALACGTPVVTTRGTDIWRELTQSGGVEVVDNSPPAFAGALAGLLRDRDMSRAMGEAGRRWIFEWLDPGRIITRFEGLYRTAAQSRKGSPS